MAVATSDADRIGIAYLEEVWNDRDYARIPELVSDSFVMYDPAAVGARVPGPRGEVHGPDGLERFVRDVVAGFPDFHVAVRDRLSDAGTLMYEGTLTMTHEGPFYWVPPTGRSVSVRYMGSVRVEDGRVWEHRVYPPATEILAQLGYTSPAVVRQLPRLAWGLLTRRR